jgi:EpsI family protein
VYYWFQQRGRVMTNEYLVKWYIFWDAITRNRTDGSLVRLTTQIPPGDNLEKADALLQDFSRELTAILPKFIPN